jgi:hypothetical protein
MGGISSDSRISGFLAKESDCVHHVTQLEHERDHPLPHKTIRKESEGGERDEHMELLQHKAKPLVLAVLTVNLLQR